jgi:hypothetical protein
MLSVFGIESSGPGLASDLGSYIVCFCIESSGSGSASGS